MSINTDSKAVSMDFPMQNVYLPTQTIFLSYKMLYINMQIFEEYFRGTNGGQNFA